MFVPLYLGASAPRGKKEGKKRRNTLFLFRHVVVQRGRKEEEKGERGLVQKEGREKGGCEASSSVCGKEEKETIQGTAGTSLLPIQLGSAKGEGGEGGVKKKKKRRRRPGSVRSFPVVGRKGREKGERGWKRGKKKKKGGRPGRLCLCSIRPGHGLRRKRRKKRRGLGKKKGR